MKLSNVFLSILSLNISSFTCSKTTRIIVRGYANIEDVVYRAVLFDLDGTLLNTLRDIADSVNNVLGASGFPQHEVAEYKFFVGSGMRTTVFLALPENRRDESTIDNINTQVESEYSRRWTNNTRPYPGIPELLDALTAAGIKIAILSNKPQKATKQTVSILLAQWHFEIVVGAQPSVPLKPDPMAALQIARHMNISLNEFIYLGDSAIDMKTAIAAKMYPVGASWGYRTSEELLSAGAKALIEQPQHLLCLLQN